MDILKCTVPRGQYEETRHSNTAEVHMSYKCIYDPTGDFLGGFFDTYSINASKEIWEVGTTFESVENGKRIRVVPQSRPRPDRPKKCLQYLGKEMK